MLKSFIAAILVALLSTAAFAASVDNAQMHFKAIAAGDVERSTSQYAQDAVLVWIGGPLDGTYSGMAELRAVWTKFMQQQGEIELTVGKIVENANPKGSTVTADVVYNGKIAVKVRHILVIRDGKIITEIWQIDPKLGVSP